MEVSCEMRSEDDKGHPEKNKKRIIKTRAQTEGLEKFYEEHKYPTESMKSELAESLGLTEKQVSGWFCHRRLKDRRLSNGELYANGRQDRSSGVIQDHGSGLRQDSCGSTKQGDDKNCDHREVESRILTGPEVSTADITYEIGTHYRGKSNCMDDTSSRSTSSLRNECFSLNAESVDIVTSSYLSQNLATDFNGVKQRTGPSGYLKVKGKVENASITAVKRQLGRHYRPDGPPLGVEFDPLPPGAFESSVRNPVNDPYYSGEPVPACTPDLSKAYRQTNSFIEYGSNSKTKSHDSDMDGVSFKRITKSAHPEYSFSQKPRRKSSEHNRDHTYTERNSALDMCEGSAREMAVDSRYNSKFMVRHEGAEIRTSTESYVGKVNRQQAKPRFTSLKAVEKEHVDRKRSNFNLKGSNYRDIGEIDVPRKVGKEYISGNRTPVDENCNLVHMKIPQYNGARVAKRARDEVPDQQEYSRKSSGIGMTLQTNHQIRSAAEMPFSFNDDDETETSSFEG